MAQFIETNQGGKNLHFEGYVYTKIRDGANSLQFWRCQNHKAGCPARATSEGSSVVVRRDHDHQRRRRVKEKEKRIQTLFDRFNAGNISLEEYLGAIKHQTGFN